MYVSALRIIFCFVPDESVRDPCFRASEKLQSERKCFGRKPLTVDNSRPEFSHGKPDQHARIQVPPLIGYGAHTVRTYVFRETIRRGNRLLPIREEDSKFPETCLNLLASSGLKCRASLRGGRRPSGP